MSYGKIASNLISILGLAAVQISFLSVLPPPLSSFNLALVVLLFIFTLSDSSQSLFWLLSIGILFDLFSFAPFGINLLTFVLTFALLHFSLRGLITDRSLYSFLALAAIATVSLAASSEIIRLFFYKFIGLDYVFNFRFFYGALAKALALNLAATVVGHIILNFISHRFKPVFLPGKKAV